MDAVIEGDHNVCPFHAGMRENDAAYETTKINLPLPACGSILSSFSSQDGETYWTVPRGAQGCIGLKERPMAPNP